MVRPVDHNARTLGTVNSIVSHGSVRIEFDFKAIPHGRGIIGRCHSIDQVSFDHKVSGVTGCAILAPEIKTGIFQIFEYVVADSDALGVPIIGRDGNTPNSLVEFLLDDDIICAPSSRHTSS